MDDWSFPCGLKINGRGLLILGIDYQMVGPRKPLHLNNRQRKTRITRTAVLFSRFLTEKACIDRDSTWLVQARIRRRGTPEANASLLVR